MKFQKWAKNVNNCHKWLNCFPEMLHRFSPSPVLGKHIIFIPTLLQLSVLVFPRLPDNEQLLTDLIHIWQCHWNLLPTYIKIYYYMAPSLLMFWINFNLKNSGLPSSIHLCLKQVKIFTFSSESTEINIKIIPFLLWRVKAYHQFPFSCPNKKYSNIPAKPLKAR